MEWPGLLAWLATIGACLWIVHSIARRLDWSNRIHRLASIGLLLVLVGISIRLAVMPLEHFSDATVTLLSVTPWVTIGIAASLIHTGFDDRHVYKKPANLLGGLLLLLAIAVMSNIAVAACVYSDSGWGYVWLFFELATVAIIAIMVAIWYALSLPGKRRAAALLFFVVFPVGLILGLMLRLFLTPACMTWGIG